VAEVARLRQEGKTIAEIAKELGLSRATVYRTIRAGLLLAQ
jgi:DNA-binding CsgD family transcriptional regulator